MKNLTFSEFKVCSRSYEETDVCVTPCPDESNNILQMKTTFRKIKPRNKVGVSMHSHYDYKSTNYNYNNDQKPQQSREDYKNSLPGKTNVCGRMGHKAFDCKNRRQSDFYHNIRTYSKGQTYFFALGYDNVSDKTNLLILTKILNPGNHFDELADRGLANNIVLKRAYACIYLCNSKGHMEMYLKKYFIYSDF